MARPRTIASDERYGKWRVINFAGLNEKRRGIYLCECDCGTARLIRGANLKNGTSKSCGCESGGTKLAPYQSLFNCFVREAHSKGHQVCITFAEFVGLTEIEDCHYCDAPIFWSKYIGGTRAYNLDRKNNEPFYSLSNVAVCCARCNLSKSDSFSYEEWVEIGKVIRSWSRDINAARNILNAGLGCSLKAPVTEQITGTINTC